MVWACFSAGLCSRKITLFISYLSSTLVFLCLSPCSYLHAVHFLFISMYVCVLACVCECVLCVRAHACVRTRPRTAWVFMCMCMWVPEETRGQHLPKLRLSYLRSCQLARPTAGEFQGLSCFCLYTVRLQTKPLYLAFYMGAGDVNKGPHAWAANIWAILEPQTFQSCRYSLNNPTLQSCNPHGMRIVYGTVSNVKLIKHVGSGD